MAFFGLPLQPRKGGKDMVAPTTHCLLVYGSNVSLLPRILIVVSMHVGLEGFTPSSHLLQLLTQCILWLWFAINSDERSVWGRTFPPVVMSVK